MKHSRKIVVCLKVAFSTLLGYSTALVRLSKQSFSIYYALCSKNVCIGVLFVIVWLTISHFDSIVDSFYLSFNGNTGKDPVFPVFFHDS